MKKANYIFLLFAILLLQNCGGQPAKTENKEIPSRQLRTEPVLSEVYESFDSLKYIFNQQDDTTYVINFWATWCKPCVEELPYFEYMNKTYLDEKLKVVLISLDSKKTIETKLKPFIEREKLLSHNVVLTDINYDYWINEINEEWDGAIPVTIIYNKENYEFIEGDFSSYNELDSIVQTYLKS